jgi:hypothetical protein
LESAPGGTRITFYTVERARLLPLFTAREQEVVNRAGGTLYSGVKIGMPQLARVYRLFLVSNCQAWYLACFLDHSGLRSCFTGWDCYG